MPKIVNIPRLAAKKWEIYSQKYELTNGDFAWISISEPNQQETIVSNPILDKFPNLKIAFWDITFHSVLTDIKNGVEIKYHPPTYDNARQIVNFILKNEGRDIIVNCAAGYSRSTAVCKFCEDILGYEWLGGSDKYLEGESKEARTLYWGKKWSDPNLVLYQKMVDYYHFPILTYFSDSEFSEPKKSGVRLSEVEIHEGDNP